MSQEGLETFIGVATTFFEGITVDGESLFETSFDKGRDVPCLRPPTIQGRASKDVGAPRCSQHFLSGQSLRPGGMPKHLTYFIVLDSE